MTRGDIEKINEWFDRHTQFYGTYRTEREYSIDEYDIRDFTRFLGNAFPDLIGIRCYIGKNDSNIWFFKEDLEAAEFY